MFGSGRPKVSKKIEPTRCVQIWLARALGRERNDMPAIKWEITAAEHEGVRFEMLVSPVEILRRNGRTVGLKLVRMHLDQFDRSGRKRPEPIPNSEFTVEADTIVSAIGQRAELDFVPATSGVGIQGDVIEVVDGQRTAGARIYAGGDITTGPAMVVDAIQAGQQAARGIDEDIRRAQGLKPWHDLLQEDIEIPFEVDEDITPRPQVSMPEVAPAERRGTFEEVELGYTLELAMAEARRCRRCDGPDQ